MNIVVCVKYVPDPDLPGELEGVRLRREGLPGLLDPIDQSGVEAGVQLKEAHGGQVTLASMGPAIAEDAIRRGLAMGADRGLLVTDQALEGADALITARVLAAAIGRAAFDLVICGAQSSDGYTGTLGAMLAEFLTVPHVGFVRKIEAADGAIRVHRETSGGHHVVECPLPALITVTPGLNVPRFPPFQARVAAKKKPLERLTPADLGLTGEDLCVGQSVVGITPAEERTAGEIIVDDGTAPGRIAELLKELKVN